MKRKSMKKKSMKRKSDGSLFTSKEQDELSNVQKKLNDV